MIPVVTVNQMREIDERVIGGDLTIGYSLMLKAGMGIYDTVRDLVPEPNNHEIAIICGKGNNGGDGYVAGRLLIDSGYTVFCYSICETEILQGEARFAYNEYINRKGGFIVLHDVVDIGNLSRFALIIDAMLGTGLKGNPHGLCASVIDEINASGVPVVAVDTPSGLDNDTGIPAHPCVKAHTTVTMGFPKLGMYFYPGREFVGNLNVKDLGYPDEIVDNRKNALYTPDIETLSKKLPPRKQSGSKHDHGLALLLCGSRGMTGSAVLASEAALRSGCGMAHLAIPESMVNIVSCKLTETVIHPIHETSAGTPSLGALEKIKELISKNHAICIGPGISHETQTSKLVKDIVKSCTIPMVIDADGLNAFKDNVSELAIHAAPMILTPHKGEWIRLFGELSEDPIDMIESIKTQAIKYDTVIILKGSPTIIASPDGDIFISPFGNSSLAKAGSGDVLSGIIVSFLAQGASPIDASLLGCFILGESARLASEELTEYSVLARDVIDNIGNSMQLLAGKYCESCF